MKELRRCIEAAGQDRPPPPWLGNPFQPPSRLGDITQRAIDVYMLSKQEKGGIGGIGWWQWANGYTAIARHDLGAATDDNYNMLVAEVQRCEQSRPHHGLFNEFNDDTLWWGLCCFHIYTLRQDEAFLRRAQAIWSRIYHSDSFCRPGQVFFHGTDMEGALFWTTRPGEDHINSITTGLFAELGLRLALLERANGRSQPRPAAQQPPLPTAEEYIDAARHALGWILRCRYDPGEVVVLDNILLKEQQARDWKFTYTTGVTIGVCALLYEATREEDCLTLACVMAKAAMRRRKWVEENGVLTESGAYGRGTHDPYKDNDAVGFKAVLIRQLAMLMELIERTKSLRPEVLETATWIRIFINVNLQSQIEQNSNGKGNYGPWWAGPYESPTSHSQMAVLDVMAAAQLARRTK